MSGARDIHICHHLCHHIRSPSPHLLSSSADLATKEKQKKRKIHCIHLLIPHHLALRIVQQLPWHVLSSLALLCTLISYKKDASPTRFFRSGLESRFGIGFRVPCSECRCARLQSLMSQKGKYTSTLCRYRIHVLRCTGSGQLVSAPRPRCWSFSTRPLDALGLSKLACWISVRALQEMYEKADF